MTDRELALLESFKTDDVRNILLVQNDDSLFKVILTWPNVSKNFTCPISHAKNIETIWACLNIDFRDWAERCNMKAVDLQKIFKMLSRNNIIFPDGSISSHVNSFLTRKSVAMLNKVIEATEKTKRKTKRR